MPTPTRQILLSVPLAVSLLVAVLAGSRPDEPQDPKPAVPAGQDPARQPDMAAMMAQARRFTAPGKQHKELERFLGKWQTETRMFMGDKAMPAEAGTAEFSWLMPGRWLRSNWSSSMLGNQYEGFLVLGYDNFKMSFVMTTVTGMDTAMNRCEGDLDPGGKAMLLYGTIDEYLTGEHDKMVKYIWRFPSADKLVFEVHDLPIGENRTKVVEVVYTREAR